jgi:hypothetical protein
VSDFADADPLNYTHVSHDELCFILPRGTSNWAFSAVLHSMPDSYGDCPSILSGETHC